MRDPARSPPLPKSTRMKYEENARRYLSAWWRHDRDQRGLAGLDHLDRFLERGCKFIGIGDRTSRPHPHRAGELGVVDRRIFKAGADRGNVLAQTGDTVTPARHTLHVHRFLVIATIVVHDREQRNLVLDGGPQHARSEHHVTVGLEVHREATECAISQRRADAGRGVVTDAIAARSANVVIVLVHRPKPAWP